MSELSGASTTRCWLCRPQIDALREAHPARGSLMSWRVGVTKSRSMECFRGSIYSVLMFLANGADIFVILLRRQAPNSRSARPYRSDPGWTRFAFPPRAPRRCGEPAGELETVSFDILIAQRRYAGVPRPPCQSQHCGVSDFHSYALTLMNLARHAQDADV